MIPKVVKEAAVIIHGAICEDSFEECLSEWGHCIKAANQLNHAQRLKEASNG
ncbi:hypothetical protein [Timonella senegalensis]|uniref:hypothetical protein n=1 Tax=Timonella senegalensis TaxID=1465825 RepID=UPI002FDDD744